MASGALMVGACSDDESAQADGAVGLDGAVGSDADVGADAGVDAYPPGPLVTTTYGPVWA